MGVADGRGVGGLVGGLVGELLGGLRGVREGVASGDEEESATNDAVGELNAPLLTSARPAASNATATTVATIPLIMRGSDGLRSSPTPARA